MTHEYVIAVGGSVAAASARPVGGEATAIAWAADRVLAVGADVAVWSISRGDSTFLDLGGAAVTALPGDPDAALRLVRHRLAGVAPGSGGPPLDASTIQGILERAGLLPSDRRLEPGSAADLACWGARAGTTGIELLAIIRHGAFVDGDPQTGPFGAATIP